MSSLNCLRQGTPALGSYYVDDELACNTTATRLTAPLRSELSSKGSDQICRSVSVSTS